MFDDDLLDDAAALEAADALLRSIAESGARVRRGAVAASDDLDRLDDGTRPRAVVVAGTSARLLRAVLEPVCPVPLVAWPGPGLPGWTGPLDLVVVVGPGTVTPATAMTAAMAVHRGCTVVAGCEPNGELAAQVAGRYTTVLAAHTDDVLAVTVVLLQALHRLGLGPPADAEEVARTLDEVATTCSPFRDLTVNPAKQLASSLGDRTPLLWGGSVLAARAARRTAEAVRRATGRPALADRAEHLMPVITGAPARDLFADPFAADGPHGTAPEPALVIVDDAEAEPAMDDARRGLVDACADRDFRVEDLGCDRGSALARYACLLASGSYLGAYLSIGQNLHPPPQER